MTSRRGGALYRPAMRTTVEYERKLEAPAGWELPDLGGEVLEPRVFSSIYHDTADRSLARAGITLRRRTERGRSLWQLKFPRGGARLELEEEGGPAGPPDSLRTLLRAHLRRGAALPVAELRTRRHGHLVTSDAGTAEVTLDDVRIMDAQRVVEEFSEIEVELTDGKPAAVKAIARRLEEAGARSADMTPKLFRALPLPERKAAKTPFDKLRARLADQLREILANDPGVRLGGDDENVHAMRVATRRARALLHVGRRLYTSDVEHLALELKWLASVLGEVRDLDVLLAHLDAQAARLEPADAAAAHRLLSTLRRSRSRARKKLLTTLDGDRYAALLDRFEQSVNELEPTEDATSLRTLAEQQRKKLRRQARGLGDDAEDELLHDVRKRGKRVRYAYELAGDEKVVRRAKELQD